MVPGDVELQPPGEAAQLIMPRRSDLAFALFLLILITNYNGDTSTAGVKHENHAWGPEAVGGAAPVQITRPQAQGAAMMGSQEAQKRSPCVNWTIGHHSLFQEPVIGQALSWLDAPADGDMMWMELVGQDGARWWEQGGPRSEACGHIPFGGPALSARGPAGQRAEARGPQVLRCRRCPHPRTP